MSSNTTSIKYLRCERRRTHRWDDRAQTFTWLNDLTCTWTPARGGRPRNTVVPVAFCHETWTDAQGVAHRTQWAWISQQPLTMTNIIAPCNRAGRHR